MGGVLDRARRADVPMVVIAGQVFDDADDHATCISLADLVGLEAALADPLPAVAEATTQVLQRMGLAG